MRQWLQVVYNTSKVFILFTGCTVLFYFGLMWITEEYQDYHRYDEPEGKAVKASTNTEETEFDWLERLKIFYKNGE